MTVKLLSAVVNEDLKKAREPNNILIIIDWNRNEPKVAL
jgi:hypothetical protein